MKRLLVLRHAKAAAAQAGVDDHDRPLEELGRRQAAAVGRLLREEALVPDGIVCSSALRALETARLAAEACEHDEQPFVTDRLYAEDVGDWVTLFADLPDSLRTVMIVGHNPGLEDLVEKLTRRAEGLSPASFACIDLPLDSWSDLHARVRGRLSGIWRL